MDIFDLLTMIGGLCLFLFGMNIMGQALERRAGGKLRSLLGRMTSTRFAGFLTGLGVTAIIQSSSATTVMVVGFVNSGLLTLRQAISVIMGANVGTTVTSWILSLSGISGDSVFIRLLSPSSFSPVLALLGIVFFPFCKSSKKKDSGMILLAFATLMFGMEAMSGAVGGLADVPAFRQLFLMFENPLLGLLAGAVLTAIIQSSSASVGILQALAVTGQVTYGSAIPIIMGQNIGTCITAIISSVGTNKNAKRAAFVHLSFNVIGSAVLLGVYSIVRAVLAPAILGESASIFGIAVIHTVFNLACVVILMPMSSLLEKMACAVIRDDHVPEKQKLLDERLLVTPPLALERCMEVTENMARLSVQALKSSLQSVIHYDPSVADKIRADEEEVDHYEDVVGSYLVKLSGQPLSAQDSESAAGLLKIIGDFERISDHAVNILESAEELRGKNLTLTETAMKEYEVISSAISEILDLTYEAFSTGNAAVANEVEPLEQVIDVLKEQMRTRHILRMQQGNCRIEVGFVWSDLLTNLERTSDHCSNIAGCVLDTAHHHLNLHQTLRATKAGSEEFDNMFRAYANKYTLSE